MKNCNTQKLKTDLRNIIVKKAKHNLNICKTKYFQSINKRGANKIKLKCGIMVTSYGQSRGKR